MSFQQALVVSYRKERCQLPLNSVFWRPVLPSQCVYYVLLLQI